jgi:thioredoxin-like negative regulator of GroEL
MSAATTAMAEPVQLESDRSSEPELAPTQIAEGSEHEAIAKLAYALWQQRGYQEGSAEKDWMDAEQQLRR